MTHRRRRPALILLNVTIAVRMVELTKAAWDALLLLA